MTNPVLGWKRNENAVAFGLAISFVLHLSQHEVVVKCSQSRWVQGKFETSCFDYDVYEYDYDE